MLKDKKIKILNFLQDFGCARLNQLQILFDDTNNNFKNILDSNMVSKKGDVFVHNTKKINEKMLVALDILCKYKSRLSKFYLGYEPVIITFLTKDNLMYHIIVADEENKKGVVKLVNSYPLSLPKVDKLILAFPDSKGLWVGKFETGYKGASSKADAEKDEDASKIIVKPNEYSWRGVTLETMYQNSINYKTDLNSHMMKNTEWGAVAYLTNSVYLTGYAAKKEPTTGWTNTNESCTDYPSACNEWSGSSKGTDGTANYQYFNTNSVVASTTNNYTGIYDMSGGSWEYVMGVMVDANDNLIYLKSGLTDEDLTDERYYDAYKYSTNDDQFLNRILGDATGEMGPFIQEQYKGTLSNAQTQYRTINRWYHDEGWFVGTGHPWFERSGFFNFGFGSGVFTFGHYTGEANADRTFRIALAF